MLCELACDVFMNIRCGIRASLKRPGDILPVRAERYHKWSFPYVLFIWPILPPFLFWVRSLFLYFCPTVRSGDITVGVWVCMYCTYTRLPQGLLLLSLRLTKRLCALVMIASSGQSHDLEFAFCKPPSYLTCSFCFRFLRDLRLCTSLYFFGCWMV